MKDSYIFVLLIIMIVVASGLLKTWLKHRPAPAPKLSDDPEAARMREEMQALKQRVQVLERIATDRNHLLEQEIDALRDLPARTSLSKDEPLR